MTPILAGWKPEDTILNELEPAKTWIVTAIEDKDQGRWIEISPTPDCANIPGTNSMGAFESILVRMGFHAFRHS